MLNGAERSGGGDRFIAQALATAKLPVVVAVNKVDVLSRGQTAAALVQAAGLEQEGVDVREIVPVSALKGARVDVLRDALAAPAARGAVLLPRGAALATSRSSVALAELVREQALKRTREEVPHSIEVQVEERRAREDGLTVVRAVLWVETESQKGILIGTRRAHGPRDRHRRAQGDRARARHPRPPRPDRQGAAQGWRRDEGLLDRLGIEA